jgi:Ca2+-binding EF-hand superfamily protein
VRGHQARNNILEASIQQEVERLERLEAEQTEKASVVDWLADEAAREATAASPSTADPSDDPLYATFKIYDRTEGNISGCLTMHDVRTMMDDFSFAVGDAYLEQVMELFGEGGDLVPFHNFHVLWESLAAAQEAAQRQGLDVPAVEGEDSGALDGPTEHAAESGAPGDELYESFQEFDTDRKGYLSQNEVAEILLSLGYRTEPSYVSGCISSFGSQDDNGLIMMDFEGFLLLWSHLSPHLAALGQDDGPEELVDQVDDGTGVVACGDTVEATPDRTAAPETALYPLHATFREYDTNDQGYIGRPEVRELLQHLGYKTDEPYVDSLIAMLNKDGDGNDGRIQFEQFTFLWEYLGAAEPEAAGIEADAVDPLYATFQKYELDNKGHLSKGDVTRMLTSLDGMREPNGNNEYRASAHAHGMMELFAHFDSDHDGRIQFSQFKLMWESLQSDALIDVYAALAIANADVAGSVPEPAAWPEGAPVEGRKAGAARAAIAEDLRPNPVPKEGAATQGGDSGRSRPKPSGVAAGCCASQPRSAKPASASAPAPAATPAGPAPALPGSPVSTLHEESQALLKIGLHRIAGQDQAAWLPADRGSQAAGPGVGEERGAGPNSKQSDARWPNEPAAVTARRVVASAVATELFEPVRRAPSSVKRGVSSSRDRRGFSRAERPLSRKPTASARCRWRGGTG